MSFHQEKEMMHFGNRDKSILQQRENRVLSWVDALFSAAAAGQQPVTIMDEKGLNKKYYFLYRGIHIGHPV
ncbi:unnamed protein product [Amoebophrya sp. A25]|nr:unnamed protein product [Amoebophrya sp. A25]|eukprot:GSA25T00021000001.1